MSNYPLVIINSRFVKSVKNLDKSIPLFSNLSYFNVTNMEGLSKTQSPVSECLYLFIGKYSLTTNSWSGNNLINIFSKTTCLTLKIYSNYHNVSIFFRDKLGKSKK